MPTVRSTKAPRLRRPGGVAALAGVAAVIVGIGAGGGVGMASPARRPRPAGLAAPPVSATIQAASRRASSLGVDREVGQLIIATYAGPRPSAAVLAEVRAGHVGGVILMGDDIPNAATAHAATSALQRAARAGGYPGLLIMTDQEGGEVERLAGGPPGLSAAQMGRLADSRAGVARVEALGARTGRALAAVGVNLDLAPDADVVDRSDNFLATTQRSFSTDPARAARAACAFAAGLNRAGVGDTLKHFPGLGDAGPVSTDTAPVSIQLSPARLAAADAAYRACAHGPLTAVMMSNAAYPALTGTVPAVLAPVTYRQLLPAEGVRGLLISDSLDAGAIRPQRTPALRAIQAGDDMVMYANVPAHGLGAGRALLAAVRHGQLSRARLDAAAGAVLALKAHLGLG